MDEITYSRQVNDGNTAIGDVMPPPEQAENAPPKDADAARRNNGFKYKSVPSLDQVAYNMQRAQEKKLKSVDRHNPTEFQATETLPRRINRPLPRNDRDIYDMAGYKRDPRRRKSWPEFCRQFIGEHEGEINSQLMELYNSMNPSDHIQFLKFVMEMGKTGYPANLDLEDKNNKDISNDMYAMLEEMSSSGYAQDSICSQSATEDTEDPAKETPQQEDIPQEQDILDQYESFSCE